MQQDITKQILRRIHSYGTGSVFSPKDFIDLTSHQTARQVLSRLTKQGKIRRLLRGIYEYPNQSKLLKGPASPDPDVLARYIAKINGWTITPSGQTALNLLGLSTQVPAKWEYFSDGPSRSYEWKGGTLSFEHRVNKETTALSPKTALLVQALKTLGIRSVDRPTIASLHKRLSERDRKRAAREAKFATSWVYEVIKKLAESGEPKDA